MVKAESDFCLIDKHRNELSRARVGRMNLLNDELFT